MIVVYSQYMEIKQPDQKPQQTEEDAIEQDIASDRAKNNGTWERVELDAALNAQVNQHRGDFQ